VQAGDELQAHRLAEVQVFARGGQDRVHVPQVRPDHRGALIVRHQRFRVQEDDRVVVNVNHAGAGIKGLGDLVRVGLVGSPVPMSRN
jgi:hypothetical protein